MRLFEIWKTNLAKKYLTEEEDLRRFKIGSGVASDNEGKKYFQVILEHYERNLHNSHQEMETPIVIDYRRKGLVTRVKNQHKCFGCWVFGATGGIEGVWAKKMGLGKPVSVSEQQLIDCGPGDCKVGGKFEPAFNTAKRGIMLEEDYPYELMEKTCRFDRKRIKAYVDGSKRYRRKE